MNNLKKALIMMIFLLLTGGRVAIPQGFADTGLDDIISTKQDEVYAKILLVLASNNMKEEDF